MTKFLILFLLPLLSALSVGAAVRKPGNAGGRANFWIGADISGATEMEQRGELLYNKDGKRRECTALMKELGFNAVRLRVWVDPPDGHNGAADVLKKALRAKKLGLPVMIDFHYSDTWADPKNQKIPAAWQGHNYSELRRDVAKHTTDVLTLLKKNGVKPKWVQIGNETANGFLWPAGNARDNPSQYAGLFMAGRLAAKKVFPDAAVIVHLNNGYDAAFCEWNLGVLKDNGAKWDAIGLSIYPYWAQKDKGMAPDDTLRLAEETMKHLAKKFSCDVMVVETGFQVDESNPAVIAESRLLFARLLAICKSIPRCRGVFYWEPECRPFHYKLGAFDSTGHPTDILSAISDCQ